MALVMDAIHKLDISFALFDQLIWLDDNFCICQKMEFIKFFTQMLFYKWKGAFWSINFKVKTKKQWLK